MKIRATFEVLEDDGETVIYAPKPTVVDDVDDKGLAKFTKKLMQFAEECHHEKIQDSKKK